MMACTCRESQRHVRLVALLLFVSLFPLAGRSAAQQAAAILGQITDDSGGVLPGVTVTATSPALQIKAVIDVTNERGEYRLSPLPIGTYAVEYALPGFQTVRREDVRLIVGFQAKLDISLKVGALAETVTVSGATPVVDVSSTGVSTQLTSETLSLLPSARNGLQALMRNAPGARTNIDVGGNDFTAVPLFHAFGQDGNGWTQLDGVATMTVKRRSAGGTPRWDYETIEEAQVQSLGGDADVPTKGIQVNAVLKSGGNEFHGTGSLTGTGHRFEGSNLDSNLIARGLTSSSAGINSRYDYSGDVGGRIVRDKLWFYGEARLKEQVSKLNSRVPCVTPEGSSCVEILQLTQFTEKISYQLNPSNRFSHYYHYGDILSTRGGEVNNLVPYEGRSLGDQFSSAGKVDWQVVKGSSLVISALFGFYTWDSMNRNYSTAPATTDLVTTVTTGGANTGGGGQPEYRMGPRVSLSWYKPNWFFGNHAFKTGFDWLEARADSSFPMPAGNRINPFYLLRFRSGVADSISLPNYPVDPVSRVQNIPVYAQDSWTLARRLTLGLGIRYEHSASWAPKQCRVASPPPGDVPFPAACYNKFTNKSFNPVVPRLRVAYDVTGDGKTVIKGGYGRYALLRVVEDPQAFEENGPATSIYRWRDLNGNRLYDPGEVNWAPNGPDFLSSAGVGRSLSAALASVLPNPDEKQGMSHEYSASVERELVARIAVRMTGVYSKNVNNVVVQNGLRPYGVYNIPITKPDPGPDGVVATTDDPGRSLTYYDFPAAYAGAAFQQRMSVNDSPRSDQWFKSYELAVSRRLTNRWQMLASYSRTWKHIPWAPAVGENESNLVFNTDLNPNSEINTGDYTNEWLSRIQGSYNFPGDVLFSANYEHRSGNPFSRTVLLTGGTQIPSITVNAEPLGAEHYANIAIMDLSVRKVLQIGTARKVTVRANIYNALNKNTVTAQTVVSGPNYGRPTAILLPRIVEFGGVFNF